MPYYQKGTARLSSLSEERSLSSSYVDTPVCSINSYRKDIKMVYERDPESPFSKIVVRNGSSVVGTIRRNLKTGLYHFCDNQRGGLNCQFQEKRIDSIKMRIEELHDLPKAS
jgi:hypothetical protein